MTALSMKGDLRAVGAHAGAVREQTGHPERDPDQRAIGIALDGYFVDEPPNPRMLAALIALLDGLTARFAIDPLRAVMHREVKSAIVEPQGYSLASPETECPGDDLAHVVGRYREERRAEKLARGPRG